LLSTYKKQLEEKKGIILELNKTIDKLKLSERNLNDNSEKYKLQIVELNASIENANMSPTIVNNQKYLRVSKKVENLQNELSENFKYLQLAQEKVTTLSEENDSLLKKNNDLTLQIEEL